MTDVTPKPRQRKRLLLIGILTALVLAATWIAYFLLNFDLNNYRLEAEARLSSMLSLPVKIGAVDFYLHDTNLALQLSGLQIGDQDSSLQIDAPNSLLNLKWLGLLSRNFSFSKISLIKPRVSIRTTASEPSDGDTHRDRPAPFWADRELLEKINVNKLEIINGLVEISIVDPQQVERKYEISIFDSELGGIGIDRTAQLSMRGELGLPGQDVKSPWQVIGQGSLEPGASSGLTPAFNIDMQIRELDLGAIRAAFPQRLADFTIKGAGDLQLHLEGGADDSFDFQTSLSSDNIAVRPVAAYKNPIVFNNLLASGHLRPRGGHPGIDNLSVQVDESRLAGNIAWTPQGQPFSASVSLVNSGMTMAQIRQWLPGELAMGDNLRRHLAGQGSVQIEGGKLTFFTTADARQAWQVEQLSGELRQIGWQQENLPAAEITSLPFSYIDGRWQVSNGSAQWGSLHLSVNGTGGYNEAGVMLVSLDFAGQARPDEILADWQIPPGTLTPSGNIGIDGHIEGPVRKLGVDLRADLSEFSLGLANGLKIAPRADDKLTLQGTLTPEKVSLDQGAISWAIANGHVSASYLPGVPDSFESNALLSVNDLGDLAKALPKLGKFRLSGQADLNIRQKGLPGDNPPQMTLTLRNAGLRATRHIADLSQINGRVHLTPTGLLADNLHVHLGQSSLTVQAGIADFSKPNLVLDVKAPTIRADELVFHSDQAMLREIDGHLEIDGKGLTFAPVDVRLDGGTKASVRGTISFHEPFSVLLDITSEFARIDEVIGLWAGGSAQAAQHSAEVEATASPKRPQVTVRINASVKQGDLYGMGFHDASGVIVPTHGRLVIHPLDFSVGEGSCNAQVITEHAPGSPTLLRISGHAENVDALEVYKELLKQKSIVRGKLRGDFSLSGEIGHNYLPSSHGNFSIRIDDGVLHKFPVLSKVFSLLNISQIFALQLPDMTTKGMPFDTLTANFQLDRGVLSSDDLKIKSEAMNQSYSGQLNLIDKEIDLSMTINPLGTVDKIISRIPVAGWLLTGNDSALLAAHFTVKGKTDDVSVALKSLDTISGPATGLLKRTISLPFKLTEDPQILWGGKGDGK